jgi:hypothetical protein
MMKVIAPIRRKRKRADDVEGTPATPAPEAPESKAEGTESEAGSKAEVKAESGAEGKAGGMPDNGGILRKSAIRRWLKKEFAFPLQIREAFFTAMEAKVSEDLRRSVARARELKRSTLMAPDA